MKIGFIGAGKMAEAILITLLDSKLAAAPEVFASDISEERRQFLKSRYGINMYSKNAAVAGLVETLILAVKPQQLDAALQELAAEITSKHLVISIAAGKKIGSIETLLPEARVIRVMPNLASLVAEGMSVFCAGARATAADTATATRLLSCFGKVLELPEEMFDAVTALSGSGPAFFAYLLNAMVEAGVQEGLNRQDALLLAEQTMLGTAKVLVEKGVEPHELIASVTSAKGTTAAGLAVLDKSDVATILHRTIGAAVQRSRELSAS
jgi:pyrroline-5-carboxylate reductase